MNTINITAGEMLGMNNDLYEICKRFIKNRLNNESYTVEELQKEFFSFLYIWDATTNKPIITTQKINILIDKILQKEFDTLMDLSAYIYFLKEELSHLLISLSDRDCMGVVSNHQLTDLNDSLQILEELKIRNRFNFN